MWNTMDELWKNELWKNNIRDYVSLPWMVGIKKTSGEISFKKYYSKSTILNKRINTKNKCNLYQLIQSGNRK